MKMIRNLKLAFSFLACTTLLVLSPQAQSVVTNSIGGTIFLDYNANDLPDAGEGANAVNMILYDSTGLNPVESTTTAPNGFYLFPSVTNGTYWVAVVTNTLPAPAGAWTNTVDPDGGTLNRAMVTFSQSPSNGPAPISLGTAGPFAVLAGTTITSTGATVVDGDLGLDPGSAVTGSPVVNGVIHVNDAVAIQAKVDLVTAYNLAAAAGPATTVAAELGGTTRAPGVYSSASSFQITGTLTLDAMGDPNAVFIFQAGSTLTTAGSSQVVLINGAQAGKVFWQVGSSATLGTSSIFKGTILAMDSITLTTGAGLEGRVLARNGAVTMDGSHIRLPQLAGENDLNLDFGYRADALNAIGGTLWKDTNMDGVLAAGETIRFPSVTVTLQPSAGPVLTTSTDVGGNYKFTSLPDGSYDVNVTDTGNVLAGYLHSLGTAGSDNNSQVIPYTVTVAGGQTNTTGDFGYYADQQESSASLGNFVWRDLNGNGIQDAGEPGISNVTVTLYNASGIAVQSTLTGTNGIYEFTTLAPGAYSVGFTLPTGYQFTLRDQGTDALDSDADLTTGRTIQTVLAAGDDDMTWDAGVILQKPLLAVIGNVEAFTRDGQTIVRWDTIDSWGTAGFYLERRVGDEWVRISQELLPFPLFGVAPIVYEETDPGAQAGGTYLWRLVELENSGNELAYGPYTLTVNGPGRTYADWATAHFTPAERTDPAISGQDADPDGDRLTNKQEFLAWTDPNDADSVLQITSMKKVSDGLELSWDSVAGRSYRIALSDSLSEPFLPLAENILATDGNGRTTLTVDFGKIQMYFQVILVGGADGEQ